MRAHRRYFAVLFDLDGTLVDSYQALTTAVNAVRRAIELPELDLGAVRSHVGEGVDNLLERIAESEKVDPELRDLFERSYDEICCQQSTLLDEVEETLSKLQAAGIGMAVCTNKPTGFSVKILEHLGLARHFQAVIGPDVAHARKPDPRHLLHALGATGRAVDEALFVGDMPIDVEAARNCGIDVAAVATGSSSLVALHAARPDFLLDHFSDLVGLVLPAARS